MAKLKLPKLGEIRKALINAAGLAGVIVTATNLHGQVRVDVELGIAIATAITHYRVPNDDRAPAPKD